MTSQVNPNNIDGTYPVAGQDNDSQGFRDNFTNIRNNFTFIKAEVEDLQSKAILKNALNNTTLSNDLQGNAMVNATLTSYRETFNDIGPVSGPTTIDFTNGNAQKITMNGSTTLILSWPTNSSTQYSSIKLWVHNEDSTYTLSLPNDVTLGDPDTIAGLAGTNPPIITFSSGEIAANTDYLFEFFTFDGGATIGIRDLIRNRDINLSGFTISGSVSLESISVSGNGTVAGNVILASAASSNVVVASTTTSVDSTTGALVVKGGAGIAGNVNATGNVRITATTASPAASSTVGALVVAGGVATAGNVNIGANLITNGGRINQNYAYITLTNDQNYFANIQHQTQFFDTTNSATIANARIALPSAAIDGREINMSFLAPITALWVNSGNTTMVKWFPNASVSSGNVSVKFVYSSAASTWLKS